jgi:acyl-CoA dehydrogenase
MNLSDDWRSSSPFYNETHNVWAQTVRRFVEREAAPYLERWEEQRELPREIFRKAGATGILGLGLPEEFGGTSEGIDMFHHLVQIDELARIGSGGFVGSFTNPAMALEPVLAFGTPEIKRRVVPGIVSGEKVIAIGYTEPSGGSDLARLRTRAEKRGDHYIVNGSKTFTSQGMIADFFLVAVRTGGAGLEGVSLLLIEKDSDGFRRTKLEKMGYHCQDTATCYFDNVKVPSGNLIGQENGGFARILKTLNRDRLVVAQQCCSLARVCLEEAVMWAQQRETFGKRLGEHQVIRSKLADMTRQIGATQSWVDLCAWQFNAGTVRAADLALLKVQSSRMFEAVAREAAQVLGGASYIRGCKTERLYREVRVYAIGGGSEEIMLDLAGRELGYG